MKASTSRELLEAVKALLHVCGEADTNDGPQDEAFDWARDLVARAEAEDKQRKPGDRISYSDGRPGHNGVQATVLTVSESSMTVQFDDRADTTTIRFSDREWMDHITPAKELPCAS